MTRTEPSFDSKAALDESTTLITKARADLIEVIETYNATGPELAKTALDRLQALNPAVSSAREAAAAGLRQELPRFGNYWVPLASNTGFLLVALVNNLTSLAVQMMSPQFPSAADIQGLDAIARARAYTDAVHQAVKRNEISMACAVAAETEVATAVQEVVGLLTARLGLLAEFIRRTDPIPPPPNERSNSVKNTGKIVVNEAVLFTAEEFLNAAIKELPKHVPVVGIAVSIVSICQEVREKKKTIRERRLLMERIANDYLAPNVTDDMSDQLSYLQRDNEDVKDLLALIDTLVHRL